MVEKADAEDFEAIVQWLAKERDDGYPSFIVNADVIREYLEKGKLYVIRLEGAPVAFQAGRYSPQISVVRRDLRGQGLGRALADGRLGTLGTTTFASLTSTVSQERPCLSGARWASSSRKRARRCLS